jgi:hypothetical protein
VRSNDRRPALFWRRFSPWRARLRACAVLANEIYSGDCLRGRELCDGMASLSNLFAHKRSITTTLLRYEKALISPLLCARIGSRIRHIERTEYQGTPAE